MPRWREWDRRVNLQKAENCVCFIHYCIFGGLVLFTHQLFSTYYGPGPISVKKTDKDSCLLELECWESGSGRKIQIKCNRYVTYKGGGGEGGIDMYSFPGGSEVKASACKAGDLGSIPGSGRSPGKGNGNPLQYSCLENPMDWGPWWATVHRVAKSRTRLSNFTSLNQ